jgi:hypothetical protein
MGRIMVKEKPRGRLIKPAESLRFNTLQPDKSEV